MIQVSVPLISSPYGLFMPADQVTALLRRLAAEWVRSANDGEMDADRDTVVALAGVLNELADQIDVECIAFASVPEEEI